MNTRWAIFRVRCKKLEKVATLKCCDVLHALWSYLELLLAGDIESNPGPSIEEMLEEILQKQTLLEARLTQIEGKLDMFAEQGAKLANLEACVRDLESTVQRQQQKIGYMEDRARRNNLIVFGVKECVSETREDLEAKVIKNIFSALLGINPTSVERIHRLRKKRDDGDRPNILRLYD